MKTTTPEEYYQLIKAVTEGPTREDAERASKELEERGFISQDSPVILEYEEVFPDCEEVCPNVGDDIAEIDRCCLCEYPLTSDRECPRGCTDSENYYYAYGFIHGISSEDTEEQVEYV
ncbi:hypothetical protein COB55_02425 [Candidatus Wolfebacteria bacterium]|nr:MAG: hypothetical protein COB55_02425 [Candidatus Wolfebacteria bacterium]